jgi:uncharacterized protein (DUF983 family)
MSPSEMESRSDLELPTLGRTLRLLGRALRLRCPNCGKGRVLQHWFKLRVRCGTCGLRLERGEHDYFTGSMLLNYCLAGVIVLGALAIILIARWPEIPWSLIQYGSPVVIIVLPFLLFPFSKLLWLAADIAIRPVTLEELEWHRSAEEEFSTHHGTPR